MKMLDKPDYKDVTIVIDGQAESSGKGKIFDFQSSNEEKNSSKVLKCLHINSAASFKSFSFQIMKWKKLNS